MSGICAVLMNEHPARAMQALDSVAAALSPSAEAAESVNTTIDQTAGLGLSRRFDTQQMYSNSRVCLVCDAGLYNEHELGDPGGHTGAVPENARTAALLASQYERYGCEFVERLRGGFSVIVWDRQRKRLCAAVDGFGIKRLAYAEQRNGVLIASRADALARSGLVGAEINARSIPNILNYSTNCSPETIFTNVLRLEPGNLLIYENGRSRFKRYWDMRYGVGSESNEEALSRELESVLAESVKAHCKDTLDGTGAFLSGGTDSSTVVGLMTRLGKGLVKAFSIGFQEQPFNELEYAELAANRFQSDFHTYLVGPEDCFEALPRMVQAFDEPFGNSSAIATYFCARLAAQHGVTALLAGDGGDELFAGNEWYATEKIFSVYHKVPSVLRKAVIEPVLRHSPYPGGLVGRARGYVRRANMPGMERVLSYQFLATHPPAEIFEPDFLRSLGEYSVTSIPSRHYTQAPAQDHLDRLLYTDMKITIADSDLPKVTCMTEMAGVQPRFPFLDRSVAEFSGRVPANLKVKGFQKRYLFKRAFRNLLPQEIIHKKKHGFGIPVANWLKTDPRMRELARDTLLSQRAFERGYFRRDFVKTLFQRHEADDSSYYGDTLWTLLVLEMWHRQAVDELTAKVMA
jgi:asparagine synthase (glutamine-hydrolysing)